MDFLSDPIFWIVVTAASEIIAYTPLKSNSVVQLILSGLKSLQKSKTNGK
tara:strand:+ start:817 stop:966 length:150 start_codon:yes stop_codon:yes gene_type:complete